MYNKEIDDLAVDFQHTFDTEKGKRVLAELKRFCGQDRSSFDDDPNKVMFNEGKRSVFLRIQWFLERKFNE